MRTQAVRKFQAFTRVPNGAGRRRKSQKLRENNGSETRQAMAVITLARSCPYTSMALVLSILRLVATASTEAGMTPLERVFFESRPGRVFAQIPHRMERSWRKIQRQGQGRRSG